MHDQVLSQASMLHDKAEFADICWLYILPLSYHRVGANNLQIYSYIHTNFA